MLLPHFAVSTKGMLLLREVTHKFRNLKKEYNLELMKLLQLFFITMAFAFGSELAVSDISKVREALNNGDTEQGKLLLLRLVREKDVTALRLYAEFLIRGEYFSRNVNTALIVLDQAARLGDKISRETLVKMYRRGRFVEKSESRASYYAQLNEPGSMPVPERTELTPQGPTNRPPELKIPPALDSEMIEEAPKTSSSRPFGDYKQPRWTSDSAPSINPKATGSGFAATADGYFVTNEHVVNGCNKVYLIYQERLKRAKVLLEDATADVAILKITGNTPSYIKGSKARLTLGMEVLAAGHPTRR